MVIASNVHRFFGHQDNFDVVMELLDLGVGWNEEFATDYKPLEDHAIKYGHVRELLAARAKRKIEALGATVSGSVSKKTSMLIAGDSLVQSFQKLVSWV